MFLDEKLLKVGRSCDMTETSVKYAVKLMIKSCFDNLSEAIGPNSNDEDCRSTFRRVNNTWRSVANTLESEGKGFIKQEGFKLFVESKEEFKGVFFN